jgi:hypothetical protein
MENFIRTKYESKRWVAEGGIPDPSTLDVSDDDMVSGCKRRLSSKCANRNTAVKEGARKSADRALCITTVSR